MAKKSNYRNYIFLAASALLLIFPIIFRDSLIINIGIRAYRVLRFGSAAASGLFLGAAVYSLSKEIKKDREETRKMESAAKKEEHLSKLSVKDKLDSLELQKMMMKLSENEWSVLRTDCNKCVMQMRQMDSLQNKLHSLLKNNDASSLSDTEDILNSVEQYMCKNMRKVLNYMSVADRQDEADVEMIRTKLKECFVSNEEQIRQVQEFIFALTEYLNHQGENDNGMNMLELYKNTILDSIKENY